MKAAKRLKDLNSLGGSFARMVMPINYLKRPIRRNSLWDGSIQIYSNLMFAWWIKGRGWRGV